MMSQDKWYASTKHFNTEWSYEEYVRREKKKKNKSPLKNTEPKRVVK